MIDNVIINDQIVIYILDKLFVDDKVDHDSQWHWLRCNGHIINLSIQVLFLESNEKTPKKNIEKRKQEARQEKNYEDSII